MSLEREFRSMVVEAAYVGSHGADLPFPVDVNQVPENKLGPGDAQSKRPYPQFLALSGNTFNAISNYDSMQLSLRKRFTSGFSFDINYVWSKMLSRHGFRGLGRTRRHAGLPAIVQPASQLFAFKFRHSTELQGGCRLRVARRQRQKVPGPTRSPRRDHRWVAGFVHVYRPERQRLHAYDERVQ